MIKYCGIWWSTVVLLELEVSLVSWVTRCRTSRSSFTRGDKHRLNIPAKRSETANILLLLLHCLIETHRIPPSTPCYVCLFKEIDCCPLLKLLRNVTHTHTHTHTRVRVSVWQETARWKPASGCQQLVHCSFQRMKQIKAVTQIQSLCENLFKFQY